MMSEFSVKEDTTMRKRQKKRPNDYEVYYIMGEHGLNKELIHQWCRNKNIKFCIDMSHANIVVTPLEGKRGWDRKIRERMKTINLQQFFMTNGFDPKNHGFGLIKEENFKINSGTTEEFVYAVRRVY